MKFKLAIILLAALLVAAYLYREKIIAFSNVIFESMRRPGDLEGSV